MNVRESYSPALEQGTLLKAVGSVVGMAVADAVGHPLEFLPVVDRMKGATRSFLFDIEKLIFHPVGGTRL